jgi:general stress protein YciG
MPRREEKRRKEETGKMTVEEAGKKGGETTKETRGREFYQDIERKGGAAPKGAPRGEVSEEGEVTVRLSGKDLDVMFSSPGEAEEWKNRFASMLEQEGYHIGKEKTESMQAEAGAEATSE